MMISLMCRMKYSAKLMLSGYWYGALVYLAVLLMILANAERWSIGKAELMTVQSVLMIGLPLFNIALFANIFAEDMEERALKLVFTYRQKPYLLLAERVVLAALISLVAYALCLAAAHWQLLTLSLNDVWEVSRHAMPVNLYLSMIALLFALVGRGVLAGLGAGTLYWMLELTTMGKWTQPLFLFQSVFRTQEVSLSQNALYVTLAGSSAFILCILVFMLGRRRWLI